MILWVDGSNQVSSRWGFGEKGNKKLLLSLFSINIFRFFKLVSVSVILWINKLERLSWRYDIQRDNTQHKGLICYSQHK
jgi:hypothetical protein